VHVSYLTNLVSEEIALVKEQNELGANERVQFHGISKQLKRLVHAIRLPVLEQHLDHSAYTVRRPTIRLISHGFTPST